MITLNLSDDVALDIMAQLGGQVGSRLAAKGQGINSSAGADGKTIAKAVRLEIESMRAGTAFRNVDMQIKCKGTVAAVSNALSQLRGEGKVKMVHRGTWETL